MVLTNRRTTFYAGAMKLGVEAALVDGLLVKGDVEVDDGRIAGIGLAAPAGRGIAVAGFVDLQVNGFGGVDFLDADADGYRRAGEALLETGVTAYLPTLITTPGAPADRGDGRSPDRRLAPAHPRHAPRRARSSRPTGSARTRLRHVVTPISRCSIALLAAGPVRLMTLAPELPGAEALIDRLLEQGVAVSLGHTDANAAQANAAFDRGARSVTHLFNAMRPFLHRDPGIVGAALARDDVVVSIILDGIHLAPETSKTVWRAARGPDGPRHGCDHRQPAWRTGHTASATSTSTCTRARFAVPTGCSPAAC